MALGLMLLGVSAYFFLPIAPLPNVDFPTILVNASLPGVDPETAATSLAAPLERRLGEIPDPTADHRRFQAVNGLLVEVLRLELGALGEDAGALDDVLQLAHVARPGVVAEDRQHLARGLQPGAVVLGAVHAEEMIDEQGNVFAASPQGRRRDGGTASSA